VSEQFLPATALPWGEMATRRLAYPAPALVGITDTNALASRACNAASASRREDLFTGLAFTGRSNTYVSAHVPGELIRHLGDVAEGFPGLDLRAAERALWGDIMPMVPVVDLAVGDYLHPRIRRVMHGDPALPRAVRGDPDDLGTAALAEFLAPSVIISADSVFTRLGMADTLATTWLPMAHGLLKMAGFEAAMSEVPWMLELAVRLLSVPAGAAAGAARRHPLAALSIGAAVLLIAGQAGYLRRARLRAAGRGIGRVTVKGAEALAGASSAHAEARRALRVIEPYRTPTVEELAARHLARVRVPMTIDALAAAIGSRGHDVSAAEIADAAGRHPAFRMSSGQPPVIGIGRPARGPAGLPAGRDEHGRSGSVGA